MKKKRRNKAKGKTQKEQRPTSIEVTDENPMNLRDDRSEIIGNK